MANEIANQFQINSRLSATTNIGSDELCPTKRQILDNWSQSIVVDSIYTYTDDCLVRIEDILKGKNPVLISDFDSLVVTYSWSSGAGSDLDTSTLILNGDPTLALKSVGCGQMGSETLNDKGLKCLVWAGDDTSAGGAESVLIYWANIVNEDNYDIQPDIIDVGLFAGWHSSIGNGNINIRLQAWKGGVVSQQGHIFINSGGEIRVDTSKTINCSTAATCSSSYTSKQRVGTLSYFKDNKNGVFVDLS